LNDSIALLATTAASIGFLHTLIGPDHYLPFIVLARARRWSLRKTTLVTVACGVGHVASSVLLGSLGIALGLAVSRLETIESRRGEIAAWLLIGLGLAYAVWGLHRALRHRGHRHFHFPSRRQLHELDALQERGSGHLHGPSDHVHGSEGHADHAHLAGTTVRLTPWLLFVVFVLGPCEPLIPILMYPAATGGLAALLLVTAVFGAVTLATMLGVVWIGLAGANLLPLGTLERYSHALAGMAIFLSGLGIQILGL
jgi:nickel/cobalt exporter